ncbi:MAG: hypothetical protein ACE5IM_05515, partial [Nitrospinota bacterium]
MTDHEYGYAGSAVQNPRAPLAPEARPRGKNSPGGHGGGGGGAPLPFYGRPEGFEAMDDGDFFIPRYKLIQPGRHAEGETPGRFRLCLPGAGFLDGEALEERARLDVVPLKIQKGRVCWVDETADPFCRSADGRMPDPLFWEARPGSPPSRVCGRVVSGRWHPVCPLAHWLDGVRPPCHQVYNLLFLDAESRLPFLMSFHGAAIKPLRAFLTRIVRMRLRRLCEVRATLASARVEGRGLTYYVPTFSGIRRNEEGAYARESESLRGYDPRRTFEAETAEKGEEVGPPLGSDPP